MGTPGLYLDPAAPGVAEWLVAPFGELVARYPALAGLHLDYIRYPDVLPFSPGTRFGVGLDFGYGAPSRARFAQETGKRAPFEGSIENAEAWDDWRRERVSALVREIARTARAQRPGIAMSAAVWSHADRAYLAIAAGLARLARGGLARLRGADGLHARRPAAALPGRGLRGPADRGPHLGRPRHLAVRERAAARARADPARAGRGPRRHRAVLLRLDRERARAARGAARGGRACRWRDAIDLDAYDFALPPDRIAQEPPPSATARACSARARERRAVAPRDPRPARAARAGRPARRERDARAARAAARAALDRRRRGGAAARARVGAGPLPRARAHARAPARRAEVPLSGQRRRRSTPSWFRSRATARWSSRSRTAASPYAVGETPLPPYIRRDAPRARGRAALPDGVRARARARWPRRPRGCTSPRRCSRRSPRAASSARRWCCTWAAARSRRSASRRCARAACTPSASSCPTRPRARSARRARAAGAWWRSARPPRACSRAARRARRTSRARAGETELFLAPGDRFRVVDALLTNFHLPRSSLLLLVAAFAGREPVLAAYAEAIERGYRFYSYGDAMLIP